MQTAARDAAVAHPAERFVSTPVLVLFPPINTGLKLASVTAMPEFVAVALADMVMVVPEGAIVINVPTGMPVPWTGSFIAHPEMDVQFSKVLVPLEVSQAVTTCALGRRLQVKVTPEAVVCATLLRVF